MRLQLMSDLHCEFWWNDHGEKGFFDELLSKRKEYNTPIPDVLVLAGDIVTRSCAKYYLKMFSDNFPQVVFVAGNHEYYGSTVRQAEDTLADINLSNFHWLHNKTLDLCGKRFVGSTLWFSEENVKRSGVQENWLNDFFQIEGSNTREWIYTQHEQSKRWLYDNVKLGDIVVTHHLPSFDVVSARWRTSNFNCFFASNQNDTIYQKKPSLWLYGHTHDSSDKVLSQTRCVVNPYGYLGMEVNSNFDFSFIIDV